jgi:ribosome-associated toxin RatA of RatAB toxin-antitoxin module
MRLGVVRGGMDALEASTRVYVPPAELFAFLQDASGWETYSEHVDAVRRYGDGGPGTDYRITVSWWKLSYTLTQRVTATDPPRRIDWRATGNTAATGAWLVDPVDGRADATELRLRIEVDPDSLRGGSVTRLLPFDELIERLKPVVTREAENVLEGLVADLEGEPRSVDIEVHQVPAFTRRPASGR